MIRTKSVEKSIYYLYNYIGYAFSHKSAPILNPYEAQRKHFYYLNACTLMRNFLNSLHPQIITRKLDPNSLCKNLLRFR